jgi:WD40 repeat protein
MSTIFVSHSSKDKKAAKAIAARLRSKGYTSFFLDFDPSAGIPAARKWENEIYRQLKLSRAVIVLCSKQWLASKWCFAEFTQARAMGKEIFPLKIAPCKIEGPLAEQQIIDFTSSQKEAYERLWDGLKNTGADPKNEFAWSPDRSPYPGLEPFSEEDAAVYFGREAEVQEGLDRLRAMREHARDRDAVRIAVVLGPSGSGKSSLVRAGIAPQLARDSARWVVVPPFRPGGAPHSELAGALEEAYRRLSLEQPRRRDAHKAVRGARARLADVGRDLVARSGNRQASVLLILDQFEDLLGGEVNKESRDFWRILRSGLAEPETPLLLLATLRSDFLGAFQQCELRGMSFTSLMLAPMAAEQMAEAIARPAERAGIEIAAKLVRRILAEAGTDDALPLLSFALRMTFERRADPFRLTADDYERVGGLRGAVEKRLREILSVQPLSPEDERRLRNCFLQMVRINEEGQIARRPIPWETTPAEVRPVLERFIAARLLVSRVVNQVRMLDTVHESLFRVWKPLELWLKDNRPFLDFRRRLQGAIDAGALLPDHALPEAERWIEERGESLDDAQRRFILESMERRDRRLAEEADARRRELERERALRQAEETARREAEQRATEQTEAARRQRELAEEANRRLAETYWTGAAKARERNNLAEAAHLLALAATVEPDTRRRRNIILGVQQHNRSRFLEALTDGFEQAANLGRSSLPLAPDAILSESQKLILTRLPGDATLKGNGIVRLWNVHDSTPYGPPMVHELYVLGAAFSRNEDRILTWGSGMVQLGVETGEARLWNTREGALTSKPLQHSIGPVNGAVFSADETRILTWGDDGAARLWDALTGAPLGEPMAHKYKLAYAMFAAGGKILTVEATGISRLWQVSRNRIKEGEPNAPANLLQHFELASWSKEEVKFLSPGQSTKAAFAVSLAIRELIDLPVDDFGISNRGATRLLTWNSDGKARLINLADGSQIGNPMDHAWLKKAFFSPSGDRVVLFDTANSVRLWDSRDGRPISSPMRHERTVTGATFNRSESRLLSWSEDGTARLWDCVDSEPVISAMDHPGPVFTAAFSKDESRILTCSADGEARLWNLGAAGSTARCLEHDGVVAGAIQDQAQERILTWSASPGDRFTAWLWDSAAGRPAAAPMRHGVRVDSWHMDGTPIGGALFSKNETRILTWAGDGAVRIWGADGSPLTLPLNHAHRVWGARFSKDEDRLLTWSRDGTARLWNVADGRPLAQPMKHDKDVQGAVLGTGENSILTWSDDGTARLWSAADGTPLAPPMKHAKRVVGARLTRDGSRVLTWSQDGTARLWSASDGKPIGNQMNHEEGVNGAIFSEDESRILTWTRFFSGWGRTAGVARIWSGSDGEPLTSVMGHRAGVSGACFCCGETRVLTWSEDSTAKLWNASDGSPAALPMVHGGDVHGAELSRDHSRVLTWSEDGTARLWNVMNGTPSARPMEHGGEVNGAAFSDDESRILTWSRDGKVRLWNVEDGRLILPPLGLSIAVDGAMFCRHEGAILAWGGDYKVQSTKLWSIEADYDFPCENLVLQVETVNGTAMDEHGNVRFLKRAEWLERRERSNDNSRAAKYTVSEVR